MPRRRRVRRRRVEKPEPEMEEVLDDEEELEEEEEVTSRKARNVVDEEDFDDEDDDLEDDEDFDDDDEDFDDDDEDDLDDEDLEDEDDEEDTPPPPKKKVTPPPAKAKPAPKAKPKPAPKVEVKKVDTVVAEDVFAQLMDALSVGQTIIITRTKEGQWKLSSAAAGAAEVAVKLRGKEYWDTVLTAEYQEWLSEWETLTYAEKKAKAKKAKVKWDAHKDERIDLIRISLAYREAEGIEKYKPEYASQAARAAIKG